MEEQFLEHLNTSMELGLEGQLQEAFVREKLAHYVNDLIQDDFPRLVQLLYRLDVPEQRLQQMLKNNPGTDAGVLIAGLIIEREGQKYHTRQQFKKQQNFSGDAEEKW